MFAALLPLVLNIAPQLAGLIFGSKGEEATAKVADVVQTVVGGNADLTTEAGAAAAIQALRGNPQAMLDLQNKLTDLHKQLQAEADREADQQRADALGQLKEQLGDIQNARGMAVQLAQAHSSLAWGGVVVSVVIAVGFGFIAYTALTGKDAPNNPLANVIIGTFAAMATQVANYWLGSSQGSSQKNALLANAQNSLADSVPHSLIQKLK